ncbi:hypothetical protein AGMMS49592_5670 [Endomicrobiia bacterium]|nr:hypothetical protein AGMMS49592_5670 [Endomicrobiia bacterium]
MIQADIDVLKHYIDNGIKLIGTYESGALIAGGDNDAYKEAFTSCLADIKAAPTQQDDSKLFTHNIDYKYESQINRFTI